MPPKRRCARAACSTAPTSTPLRTWLVPSKPSPRGCSEPPSPNPDAALKGKGKVFQRLDDLADLFALHLAADIRAAVGPEWQALIHTWAARHVFTHCDGIIDAKYLSAVSNSAQRVGQRLRITESDARAAIANTENLCRAIAPTAS